MSTQTLSVTDHPTTSVGRVIGLTKGNVRLTLRNPLTLAYGIVTPLLPLALVPFSAGKEAGVAIAVSTVLMVCWLIPVFYNVLSMIVSRRDELVLKRLRTGEARDGELLLSMCLPGIAIATVVTVLAGLLATALGHTPDNPALFLLAGFGGSVLCAALAVWTASWTRNAEAAQMTSLPVFMLVMLGTFGGALPQEMQKYVALTPGGALDSLARLSWGADVDVSDALTVVIVWTAAAIWVAQRTMRWEPRR